MLDRWFDLTRFWSVDPLAAGRAFEDLCARYAGADRFYHTLAHVRFVLDAVDRLRGNCRDYHTTQLAGWLHDVIYDSRAADNEQRSADYAVGLCEQLSVPVGRRVAALILKTKTHEPADDPDAAVLLDADLAILGSGGAEYLEYSAMIRREYDWVPEPEYRSGRIRVLEQFLARPKIYQYLTELDEPARRNLAGEIARLASVPTSSPVFPGTDC